MTVHDTPAAQRPWPSVLAVAAFCSALYGFKLWVIAIFGNPTPFWDQWDAQASYLFLPLRQGTLGWLPFVVPHNEHLILTTRLLNTGLFVLNGLWNPLLEMVANAALHVAALAMGAVYLSRATAAKYLPALLLFTLVLFGLPFGWENTLAGFQAQFYFLVFFSIACLWLLLTREAFSAGWWGGIVCAWLAFFSLASGVIAVAAAAVTGVIAYATAADRKPRRQIAGVAVLVVLSVAGYLLTPVFPGTVSMRAQSFAQLYSGLQTILSWPMPSSLLAAAARNLPALAFAIFFIWKRPGLADRGWFLLGLVAWLAGQALTLAYGRAASVLQSRYVDLTLMGLLVNFACVLWLLERRLADERKRSPAFVLAAAWVVGALVAIGGNAGAHLEKDLAFKKAAGVAEEANTRAFLETGDLGHLQNKPFMMIPFPDADVLASRLRNPIIRSFLPGNLQQPMAPASIENQPAETFVENGFYPATPKRSAPAIGSYNAKGDGAMGKATLHFPSLGFESTVAIPIAGYPTRNGMQLAVLQGGARQVITLLIDPKESWTTATVRVRNGPWSLELTDGNPGTWVAVGRPTVSGRLDGAVDTLLANSYAFIALGAALAILSRVIR